MDVGKPTYQYSPDEFGANFTKRTALWGWFNPPIKPFMKYGKLPPKSSIQHKMPITAYKTKHEMMEKRSQCYKGFAKAFFEANR